jgi:hypothetical protein
MNPSELHSLFSAKEQTLLVATETARLKGLSEDELDALFAQVRRERNKYTKLYRRQSAALVDSKSSRAGTSTSNQRTKRKAEIFEDALSRVARALSLAARAAADELKRERLAAAAAAKGAPRTAPAPAPAPAKAGSKGVSTRERGRVAKGGAAEPARRAARSAQTTRNQARRDSR